MARVDANANDPVGVSQAATTQQYLIRVDRNDATILQSQVAFKFVQVFVRPLAVDHCSVEVFQSRFLCLCQLQYLLICLLMLEVSFAVQVLCLNISNTLRERSSQNQHIAREKLILLHFDDTPDLNVK